MNRRKFLMSSGAAAGGAALSIAGKGALPASAKSIPQNTEFIVSPDYQAPKKNESIDWLAESAVIAYAHTPTIEESYRRYQPHGLVYQCIFLVAIVMDEEGNKYNLLRQLKAFDSIVTHATRSVPDGVTYAQALFGPGEMYMSRTENELIGNTIEIKPYLASPDLVSIEFKAQKAHWVDVNGRIDLDYKALGPALEFYCPGLHEDNMYRSEPYRVKGRLDGKKVEGFGVIDSAWGPAGVDWAQCKIFRYLEDNWLVWMNEFDDGSVDCGVYMDGLGDFGCGIYNRDGEVIVSGKRPCEVRWTEDGFLQGSTFTVGDVTFEFDMEARVVQAPGYLSWASGTVRRVDEYRTPVRSLAWLEYLPKR
ncbi:MAG: hypothetical protein GX491_01960 [Chloroflexi bacterium]|nr:hypothetical protein [Chloroflexota bacterium]